MKFIGVNGGTFDPIHYGHLRPALEVQQQLGLEKVLFVPCYQPVHRNQPSASAQQRCKMVELAISDQPSFKLETYEIDQGGPSYMVQTLSALKLRMPNDSLVLMMGTDAFAKFHKWNDWQGILKLANIVVMHRPGEPVPMNCKSGQIYQAHLVTKLTKASGQIVEAAVTQLDISSTLIRKHIERGHAVDYLLPPSVIAVIEKQGLYQ